MSLYKVDGYFHEGGTFTKDTGFNDYIVSDSLKLPKGWTDDQIFYYTSSEPVVGNHDDFTITKSKEELL